MRQKISVGLALVFILGIPAWAQEGQPARTISVSGTVETKTAPDLIIWRITLMDTGSDLRKAKRKSDEKVTAIVALREQLEIGAGDFQTGHVSVRREYEKDERGNRTDFKHFVVTRSVTIYQRDLKRFDEYLDTLVAGAEMEISFSFDSTRRHTVRRETRLRAMETAKDKAAAMAEVAGAKLGPVLTISEHGPGGGRSGMGLSNNSILHSTSSVDIATERFVPGAISIKESVYATFALE